MKSSMLADQKQAAFLQQHDAQLQALKIDHAKELAVTESALENAKKEVAENKKSIESQSETMRTSSGGCRGEDHLS